MDKNTTVVFPAPLMSTISELVNFIDREGGAASASMEANLPSGEASPATEVQR